MPYNDIAMHKRANEQKASIQNCSLLHPFNTVASYMIHTCFQATGEPTIQYLIYNIWMDPVDKKKTVKYFFWPDCRNKRVNSLLNLCRNELQLHHAESIHLKFSNQTLNTQERSVPLPIHTFTRTFKWTFTGAMTGTLTGHLQGH